MFPKEGEEKRKEENEKKKKLKKSFLKCELHSGFRFPLMKFLLQCPPPLIVP